MKALLYKEFKLAVHPICYVLVLLSPLFVLIPSYPLGVGFIYVLAAYPILFLGANKGQQSNDLLFSTLLPVRKKDIVLARMLAVLILQLAFILLMAALSPLSLLIRNNVQSRGGVPGSNIVGLPAEGIVSIIAIGIVGFSLADLIFFPIYYRNGKSIVLSTLLTIFGFIIYLSVFTLAIPYIPGCEGYTNFLCYSGIGVQFGVLAGALVLSGLLHYLTYRISAKELELVDF